MLPIKQMRAVLTFDELSEKISPIDIDIELAISLHKKDKISSEFLKMISNENLELDEVYEVDFFVKTFTGELLKYF